MTEAKAGVLVVATMDTKAVETGFVADCLRDQGLEVLILDGGIRGESPVPVAVTREEVARAGGMDLDQVRDLGHEGRAMAVMSQGASRIALELYRTGRIKGVIGLGGSMGTTLGTAVMRALPLGVPKVMITTMASRDTRAFVGAKDIMMLHAVCDLAGLNRVTSRILANGALALAGMVRGGRIETGLNRPLAALSTLGTTEAAAVAIRRGLEARGFEVLIFHTVGAGGQAMEEMIAEGLIEAVVDLSLHELGDHRFGGDYDAGPDRGRGALARGLPCVLAPGNVDFLVTGPEAQAARRWPDRARHAHNTAITVVRSSHDELIALAGVLAECCNRAEGPWAVVVPLGGLSAFDAPGGPLYDPRGPAILAEELVRRLDRSARLILAPLHINDPEFAAVVLNAFDRVTAAAT
jgi:uncharacterized protein (UPF0261 family)